MEEEIQRITDKLIKRIDSRPYESEPLTNYELTVLTEHIVANPEVWVASNKK